MFGPGGPVAPPPEGKEGGVREVRIGQAEGGSQRPMGAAACGGRGFQRKGKGT